MTQCRLDELDRLLADVRDPDAVGEEVLRVARGAALGHVGAPHLHAHAAGRGVAHLRSARRGEDPRSEAARATAGRGATETSTRAAASRTRLRETRNQPTPFVQAGGQAEGGAGSRHGDAAAVLDVDAAGHHGAGGDDEDDEQEGDHERRLALPDARDQEEAGDELDPGQRHRDEVGRHRAHRPATGRRSSRRPPGSRSCRGWRRRRRPRAAAGAGGGGAGSARSALTSAAPSRAGGRRPARRAGPRRGSRR